MMYSSLFKLVFAASIGAGVLLTGVEPVEARDGVCHREAKRYADSRLNRGDNALATGIGGAAVGAIIGGIVGGGKGAGRGAIIGGSTGAVGSAIGTAGPWQRYYDQAYDDCLERYEPVRAPEPRPIRRGPMEPWTDEWYDYCADKYRSFNPRTGTFLSYDGVRKFCQPPG